MRPPFCILFVCLGNICRSPAAQGVFCAQAKAAGLAADLDSAGTGAWHAGHPPDRRMIGYARRRGIDISSQRARQVDSGDFYVYDLILAMDASNFADLKALQPADGKAELRMMLATTTGGDVPDPYYGADDGFAEVLDLLETASAALIEELMEGPA